MEVAGKRKILTATINETYQIEPKKKNQELINFQKKKKEHEQLHKKQKSVLSCCEVLRVTGSGPNTCHIVHSTTFADGNTRCAFEGFTVQ